MSTEIRVLGSLQFTHAESSAVPTAPKPRAILALALLHVDQTVLVRDLIQELWGDRPPSSVLTTLQTYILTLRKLLARAFVIPAAQVAETILLTRPGGYLLCDTSDLFDLHEYERLAALGRRSLAAGDKASAADLLFRAQETWRGPALADVRAGRILQPEIQELEESRLTTMEQGIEVRLSLGRHRELLSELRGLVARHRLHENLNGLLMLALYRSGRRQEALGVFQQLRQTLKQELGLDPGRRLQLLQQAILREDLSLESAVPADGLAQFPDRPFPLLAGGAVP
jgi:SARP family transcriptional regulator, regulator of embCAB operon